VGEFCFGAKGFEIFGNVTGCHWRFLLSNFWIGLMVKGGGFELQKFVLLLLLLRGMTFVLFCSSFFLKSFVLGVKLY